MSRFISDTIDFEFIDEEPGIIERMIKALDLDGEPGDITIKAGFNPNQPRGEDGKWGSGGPARGELKGCHEQAKKFDDYMDYEGQVQKQLDYTTYGSENQYKKSRWVDWFLGERQENKNAIAYDINNDPELERALKSNLYKFWKEEGTATDSEKEMTFKEFQNHSIKLYRGVSHKNVEEGTIHQNGFTSYALIRGLAEKFSKDGNVKEFNIKVSDLYGSVNVVGGEIEVLEPQPYSDEFANNLFTQMHSKLFETDFIDDPKGWQKYKEIKKDKGGACAYMYAKNYISKEKKSIADIINQKAGFKPGQARDKDGKWADKWAGMKTREQEIKDQKKETALIYDADGNLLQEIGGSEKHVDIPYVHRDGYGITHNHPNSSSFSRADIHFTMMNTKLNFVRAIGPDGVVFEMAINGKWKRDKGFTAPLLINRAWDEAKELADAEVKSYLVESLGNDWETPYWRENENKLKTAQKVFGRWSDRVNWHLANSTEFGKDYLTYKKIKP